MMNVRLHVMNVLGSPPTVLEEYSLQVTFTASDSEIQDEETLDIHLSAAVMDANCSVEQCDLYAY